MIECVVWPSSDCKCSRGTLGCGQIHQSEIGYQSDKFLVPLDVILTEMEKIATREGIDLGSLSTQASNAFTDGEDISPLTREQAEQIADAELRNYPPTGNPGLF